MSELQFDQDDISEIIQTIESMFEYDEVLDETKKAIAHPFKYGSEEVMIYWCGEMLPITPNFYSLLLEEMAKRLQGMKVIDDTDHLTSFVYNNCLIEMTSTTSFRRRTFNTVFAFEIAMVGYNDADQD